MEPNPSKHVFRIVADDRERSSGVIEVFRQMECIEVVEKRLAVGDYEVDGVWIFERKTLLDFVSSIKDGRLFNQANRLARSRQPAAVILEGDPDVLNQSGMTWEARQGALISLSLVYGLPILHSRNPQDTAHTMLFAANQFQRCNQEVAIVRGRRPKSRRRGQLRILQALPGIGPSMAVELLEYFGDVESVMVADEEELKLVKGIGSKTARAIREVVATNIA